jgi:hypothetical protein
MPSDWQSARHSETRFHRRSNRYVVNASFPLGSWQQTMHIIGTTEIKESRLPILNYVTPGIDASIIHMWPDGFFVPAG